MKKSNILLVGFSGMLVVAILFVIFNYADRSIAVTTGSNICQIIVDLNNKYHLFSFIFKIVCVVAMYFVIIKPLIEFLLKMLIKLAIAVTIIALICFLGYCIINLA